MKKLNYLALTLLLGVFVACEEDDVDELLGGNTPLGNSLEAIVGGDSYEASVVLGTLEDNRIIVSGLQGSNAYPAMTVGIPKKAPAGTYDFPVDVFDTTLIVPSILYTINDSTSYIFNSGEIVLSKNDTINKEVEGTFTGKFYEFKIAPDADSLSVSNGKFRATY
ncbi:MAG: hypothetical protein RJQ00_02780 [Vicingaceae bacterium]